MHRKKARRLFRETAKKTGMVRDPSDPTGKSWILESALEEVMKERKPHEGGFCSACQHRIDEGRNPGLCFWCWGKSCNHRQTQGLTLVGWDSYETS